MARTVDQMFPTLTLVPPLDRLALAENRLRAIAGAIAKNRGIGGNVSADDVENARDCLDLLEDWRAALRLKSRSCDLLNLALLRLDSVLVKGLGDIVELGEGARLVWMERGGHGGV